MFVVDESKIVNGTYKGVMQVFSYDNANEIELPWSGQFLVLLRNQFGALPVVDYFEGNRYKLNEAIYHYRGSNVLEFIRVGGTRKTMVLVPLSVQVSAYNMKNNGIKGAYIPELEKEIQKVLEVIRNSGTNVTNKEKAFLNNLKFIEKELTDKTNVVFGKVAEVLNEVALVEQESERFLSLVRENELLVDEKVQDFNQEVDNTLAQTKLDLAEDLTQVDNTIANINAKNTQVNTLASDFTADVATKQADVTSKYNAFDTSVTTANQTIDDILALQPQFQAVLDETTGKDVISAPEIILARNGEADLKTRLDKEKQEVTAQLAQKVGGGNKAELEDLSSTVLSAIDGGEGTSFNLLSIPQNRSVTPEKTTFLNKSTNLFNKSIVIDGKYLANSGELIDDISYVVSDFIPVKAGQTYIFKHAPWGGVWYTASKTFISGNTISPQTAPPNAAYFRMGIEKVKVDTQQMNEGNTLLPYEPYYIEPIQEFKISNDNVKNKSIPITKMDFYKIVAGSKNKFNKNDTNTLIGKYISVAGNDDVWTAVVADNADYAVSHYIEVEGNVNYINTSLAPFKTNAYFDENFVCIGRSLSNVFTTPANAKYIRVNLLATELDTAMVHVNDGTVLQYVPYTEKYQLSENITVSEQNMSGINDDNNLHNYKRIYNISDAVTQWKKGNKFPVAFMGDSTTDGATVTGNVNNTVDTIGTDHIEPNAYPYLLEQKLIDYTGNSSLRIYNAGFSGWNTNTALTHFSQIFSTSSAYSDVKMIGFVYGINDRALDLELIESNLIKLCVASYKNGIQPFIVTPQTILQGSSDFTNVQTATQLTTVIVRFLKDFAKTYNLELIDMNKATTNFIANAEIPIDSILSDILHFGDEGHKFEAGFLYSQFIGDTIEVTDDMEVSVTNPYTHYAISRAGFLTESETFRRYANFNNIVSDTLYIRAEILNSTNRKLILTLDASANSNFYFMVDGVKKLPTDLIELEIGHHRVEVYAGAGTTGKYYGFKLKKKQ